MGLQKGTSPHSQRPAAGRPLTTEARQLLDSVKAAHEARINAPDAPEPIQESLDLPVADDESGEHPARRGLHPPQANGR